MAIKEVKMDTNDEILSSEQLVQEPENSDLEDSQAKIERERAIKEREANITNRSNEYAKLYGKSQDIFSLPDVEEVTANAEPQKEVKVPEKPASNRVYLDTSRFVFNQKNLTAEQLQQLETTAKQELQMLNKLVINGELDKLKNKLDISKITNNKNINELDEKLDDIETK